jgi:hypothetical protein
MDDKKVEINYKKEHLFIEQKHELFECIRHFHKYVGVNIIMEINEDMQRAKDIGDELRSLYEDLYENKISHNDEIE